MRKLPKELEASIRQKLRFATIVAIHHDVPVQALEEILREEMVASALELQQPKASSGRVSKAMVAAATGLSRKEVLRLIRRDRGGITPLSRALNVIAEWRRQTRARMIDISMFDRIVKKSSHDIPPRALLSVMQSYGYASVLANGAVHLNLQQIRAAGLRVGREK